MRAKGIPKQFLGVYGKPILIYTLERFENNENKDEIVISCVECYNRLLLQKKF